MDYSPITFEQQQLQNYFNTQPSQVKGTNNTAVEYHKRYLWHKLYSVFKFGLPDVWSKDWFRFWLFHYGSIAIVETKEYGWIPMPYGILKLNVFYHPQKILVSSSYLDKQIEATVGKDCEIIHIADDFYGLDDLITRYATKLASVDKSIDVNLMNSNLSLLYFADDKKEADTFKEAYGLATEGNPLVTVNKKTINEDKIKNLIPNVASNYLVGDLLDARRTIVNEFLTEIGIKNANYDKKERLNSQEVNQNNDETSALVNVMLEHIQKGFKLVNEISDLNLTVELRYNYEEVMKDENNSMGNVPV